MSVYKFSKLELKSPETITGTPETSGLFEKNALPSSILKLPPDICKLSDGSLIPIPIESAKYPDLLSNNLDLNIADIVLFDYQSPRATYIILTY